MRAAALLVAALLVPGAALSAPITLGSAFDGGFAMTPGGQDSLVIREETRIAGPLGNGQGIYLFGGGWSVTTGPLVAGIFPIIAPRAQDLIIEDVVPPGYVPSSSLLPFPPLGNHLDGTVLWSQLDSAQSVLSGVLTINHAVGFGDDYVPGGTSQIDFNLVFAAGFPQSFDWVLAGHNAGLVLVTHGTIQPDQAPIPTPEPWSLLLLGTALIGSAAVRFR
jgi:hypothetical protein